MDKTGKPTVKSSGKRIVPHIGVEAAADLLRGMDVKSRERLLADLKTKDAKLAEELQQHLFRFEDLAQYEVKGVQALLQSFNSEILGLALRKCSDPMKTLVMQNISRQRAQELEEAIQQMGPRKITDVETAQMLICKRAEQWMSENKLVLKKL